MLSAVLSLLSHDAIDLGPARVLPSDVPEPSSGNRVNALLEKLECWPKAATFDPLANSTEPISGAVWGSVVPDSAPGAKGSATNALPSASGEEIILFKSPGVRSHA